MHVTARDMAELARHIMQTYPEFYPYFAARDFTWNNIRQENRNPLLSMGIGADGSENRRDARIPATASSGRRCRTICG